MRESRYFLISAILTLCAVIIGGGGHWYRTIFRSRRGRQRAALDPGRYYHLFLIAPGFTQAGRKGHRRLRLFQIPGVADNLRRVVFGCCFHGCNTLTFLCQYKDTLQCFITQIISPKNYHHNVFYIANYTLYRFNRYICHVTL